MSFVVIGTDHRFQNKEAGLGGLLSALLNQRYLEPLCAIAEEHAEAIGMSMGQQLAEQKRLAWYNVDMTSEEKYKAGILAEQRSRPISQGGVAYRVPSDEVREDFWVSKLAAAGSGTTIVICGYLHSASLARKLRARGHAVDERVYLETVPEIKHLNASSSAP
jgi:hypothetical protein